MGRGFWMLTLAQGLYVLGSVVLLAISALVGLELAPRPAWATLPIALSIVSSALATAPVARLQRRLGRRRAFQAGLGVGVLAYAVCSLALLWGSFGLLLAGCALSGFYGANASLYRFAAAELVPEALRERALSLVLVGGLLGAVLGPSLARSSRDLLRLPYAGSYAALSVLALLALALISQIQFPPMADSGPAAHGRGVWALARQPAFGLALLAASVGYGVMSLLMNAAPIAMQQHQHSFQAGALVLEWHVIAMFAPSFFSGRLIRRFGPRSIIGGGLALMTACACLALAGVQWRHFLGALILLGLGWNFLYTGASALLLQTYRPAEKTRAQAGMDFCVFTVMGLSSFLSGYLVTGAGWTALNELALLPLLGLALALAWAGAREPAPTVAPEVA